MPPPEARLIDKVRVGRFGAPHGVKGEVRLQSFTGVPCAIGSFGPLQAADGRRFTLSAVRPTKADMLVVRVAGVADRDAAGALTHLDLFVDRSELPPPDEEEFYVVDLIGMVAVDDTGAALGTVIDVPNYGAGDLLEIDPSGGGESRLYPFTKVVVPKIDFSSRRLTVLPPDEIEPANTAT